MKSEYSTLLIPVESQVRELDGKLLLACVAAEKGYKVIIGSRPHIHFHASKVKNAIYFAKSMRRFSDRMFNILHQLGHRIIAWDEEALVRLPDAEYYKHRLSPNTFQHIDHLFAWGESDAFVFKNYPNYNNQPIHAFGNPRADILRAELRNYFLPEVEAIKNQYGEFFLINTNFGQVNHFIPSLGHNEAKRDKKLDISNDFMSQRFQHKKILLEHFMTLINNLANAFPEVNFLVRPHPSESVEFWKKSTQTMNNVHVNNNGNVNAWIMAAKALISNGCTTSLEASILNKPSLGYYPISNLEIDDALPKAISDISTSEIQINEKINDVYANKYQIKQEVTTILGKHIANITGKFSVDQIIDTIYDSYAQQNSFNQPITRLKGCVHNEIRTSIKGINGLKKSHRNSSQYQKHRYPDLSAEDLMKKVDRFTNLTQRFQHIKISPLKKHLYTVSC